MDAGLLDGTETDNQGGDEVFRHNPTPHGGGSGPLGRCSPLPRFPSSIQSSPCLSSPQLTPQARPYRADQLMH